MLFYIHVPRTNEKEITQSEIPHFIILKNEWIKLRASMAAKLKRRNQILGAFSWNNRTLPADLPNK